MKKNVKFQNDAVPSRVEPDIAGFMAKIQEQLAFLEKKMDVLISQTSARPVSVAVKGPLAPAVQQPVQPLRSNEGKPAPAQRRRERIFHKAVCADCHKDCEIPFKPSGERPVYCKECFSKRKSSNLPKPKNDPAPVQVSPKEPERRVVVTKKGVGKVTVSEIVGPLVRNIFHKTSNNNKPVKKSKKA